MLDAILDTWRGWRQRSRNAAEFRERLLEAADDGHLTPAELDALEQLRAELGLDPEALGAVRVRVYERAYRAAREDRSLTPAEEADLRRLQALLALPDEALSHTPHELARLRLVHAIEAGALPSVQVAGLVLKRGEVAHWAEPGVLLEERVVGRRTVGGSSGVSIRVMRGVSFRVGQSRGHSLPIREVLPVSAGPLVVTSDRVVFRGDARSFEVRWDKLMGYDLYQDGLGVVPQTGKPRIVRLDDPEAVDVIGMLLARLTAAG